MSNITGVLKMPIKHGTSLMYTQPIYDSIILPIAAAGVAVGQFFAIPWAGLIAAAIPKTWRHTNLVQAGRMERGNEIQIDSLSMFFPRTAEAGAFPTMADMDAVRAGAMRLRFGGDTDFLKIPIAGIPNGGMGVTYSTDAALAAEINFTYNNGVPVTQNRLHLGQPIVLQEQETIGITFEDMDAIVAPIEVTFFLWGPNIRPTR